MGESFQKTAVNLESIATLGTSERPPGNARESWQNQINGIDSAYFQAEEPELSVATNGARKTIHRSPIDDVNSCIEFDE